MLAPRLIRADARHHDGRSLQPSDCGRRGATVALSRVCRPGPAGDSEWGQWAATLESARWHRRDRRALTEAGVPLDARGAGNSRLAA